jgi:hypothetical protein
MQFRLGARGKRPEVPGTRAEVQGTSDEVLRKSAE